MFVWRFRSTTAYTSHPSPRPTKPSFSVVVAFTETSETSTPMTDARHSRIGMMYGASLGLCIAMVMSALPISHPSARTSEHTLSRSILLSIPANSSEASSNVMTNNSSAARPVIVFKDTTILGSGTGSSDSPFVVK